MMSAAAHVAKKYMFAIATVYMCYLTHGIQAIILSQNKVNFYTQWGYTDAAAGAAAVLVPARGPAVAVLEVVRAVVPVAAIPAPALVLAPAQDSATPLVRPKRRQRK